MSNENLNVKVSGRVVIANGYVLDGNSLSNDGYGDVILDKHNAINNKNMSRVIARGLANTDYSSVGTHQIYAMCFGNGGTSVTQTNQVVYLAPNVSSTTSTLYNQTYFQVIDEQNSAVSPGNSVVNQSTAEGANDDSSIVVCTAVIPASLPSGQPTTDTSQSEDTISQFSFNELGLFTYGTANPFTNTSVPSDSLMLTHVIFSPILKSANRELIVTYTLTITIS